MGSPPPHTTLVCNKTCPNREYGLTISASLLSFIYYPSNSVCIYSTRQSMCCERAETNKERLKLKLIQDLVCVSPDVARMSKFTKFFPLLNIFSSNPNNPPPLNSPPPQVGNVPGFPTARKPG